MAIADFLDQQLSAASHQEIWETSRILSRRCKRRKALLWRCSHRLARSKQVPGFVGPPEPTTTGISKSEVGSFFRPSASSANLQASSWAKNVLAGD